MCVIVSWVTFHWAFFNYFLTSCSLSYCYIKNADAKNLFCNFLCKKYFALQIAGSARSKALDFKTSVLLDLSGGGRLSGATWAAVTNFSGYTTAHNVNIFHSQVLTIFSWDNFDRNVRTLFEFGSVRTTPEITFHEKFYACTMRCELVIIPKPNKRLVELIEITSNANETVLQK